MHVWDELFIIWCVNMFSVGWVDVYILFQGCRGKVDTEHTSVSSSSLFTPGSNLEFTRENIIQTNIQTNNNDIIPVINNNID